MLASSLFMLESNLSQKQGANLVSMSTDSLGRPGYWLCITVYLMLLYCLNAAYLAEFSGALVSLIGALVMKRWLCCFVLQSRIILSPFLGQVA